MAANNSTEVWLRGQLPGLLPALQPVAHALLQAREELNGLMAGFPSAQLWKKPAGVASPGFHLKHMKGVLDRLFSYANKEMLTPTQLEYLSSESSDCGQSPESLLQQFNEQVDSAMAQLFNTPADELFETRGVGRKQIPSTTLGLLVHAAEHTMRHLGQLLVTVSILKDSST